MSVDIAPVSKNRRRIKQIYFDSFPKKERMPFWMMCLMSKMKNTEFYSCSDNGQVCGFAYLAAIEKVTFIMFLAVDKTMRSKGYGSLILREIQSRFPNNKIIVSIERCDKNAKNIQQRLRRKRFYQENGYLAAGYFVELSNVEQEIMIKNGEFDQKEFLRFFQKYSNGTMNPRIFKEEPQKG